MGNTKEGASKKPLQSFLFWGIMGKDEGFARQKENGRCFLLWKTALLHKKWELSEIIRKLFFGWLIAVFVEYFLLQGDWRNLSPVGSQGLMSLGRVLLITGSVTAVCLGLSLFWKTEKWEKWGSLFAAGLLMALGLWTSYSLPFLGACILLLMILFVYCLKGRREDGEISLTPQKAGKGCYLTLTLLTIGFFLFVCLWTVARVCSFSSPTYDMGIFSQMFYSMKETGLPMTTLERDKLLSHFAVHVSPVCYLLLPFYALIPHPNTLQVLQALVVISAVIPLWKLGTHHGLTGWQRLLLCTVLLLYPAFLGGTSFDFHENCFLTPALLWLFYSIEKKNTVTISIFALLTLSVKEDGAVYVAVIALWLLVRTFLQKEKEKKLSVTGLCLLAVSILWFFLTTTYLKNRGDGVMEERYFNCMYSGNRSLWAVIRCAVVHPLKLIYECVDREKIKYILFTMAPLLGLPLLTRRYERYILLIPYILLNLIPDFLYQHSVFYQYSFGSLAFLMYVSLLNLKDIPKREWKTAFLTAGVIVAGIAFTFVILPTAGKYPARYLRERESFREIKQTLAEIPKDAIVTANTTYTVPLSQRDRIYDISYTSMEHLLESEYVVLDPRKAGFYSRFAEEEGEDGREALYALLEEQGYEKIVTVGTRLCIYKRQGPGE